MYGVLLGMYPDNSADIRVETSTHLEEIMLAQVSTCSKLGAWYKSARAHLAHDVRPPSLLGPCHACSTRETRHTTRASVVHTSRACAPAVPIMRADACRFRVGTHSVALCLQQQVKAILRVASYAIV